MNICKKGLLLTDLSGFAFNTKFIVRLPGLFTYPVYPYNKIQHYLQQDLISRPRLILVQGLLTDLNSTPALTAHTQPCYSA